MLCRMDLPVLRQLALGVRIQEAWQARFGRGILTRSAFTPRFSTSVPYSYEPDPRFMNGKLPRRRGQPLTHSRAMFYNGVQ